MQILEANERKVNKVWFKPISSECVDMENKGTNRLVSTKVIKRKKKTETDPDRLLDDGETAEESQDECSTELLIAHGNLKKDPASHATDEKTDGHRCNTGQ